MEHKENNVVYIGKKSPVDYATVILSRFNQGQSPVILRARGNVISNLVDSQQILVNRFLPGTKVESVKLSTEQLQGEDGKNRNVSVMEVTLTR